MLQLSEFFGTGRVILLLGAILLYVSSRINAHELQSPHQHSPGRRALAGWIPILAAALVALSLRRPDWAIAIIFSTSIGCLSLLLGSIVMVNPDDVISPPDRRAWPLVLPAVLLALLVGFTGNISWRNAGLLLIEGFALLYAWPDVAVQPPAGAVAHKPKIDFRAVNSILCILIALIGATCVVLATRRLSEESAGIPGLTLVVTLLAPLLILPMLTAGADLAKKHRTAEAITAAVAVVLLNLCLLLPVIALLWIPIQTLGSKSITASLREAAPMPFPWITWRIDNVLLLVLSMLLIPAALGRWRLGRIEGLALIALYAAYVLLETAGSLRWL